jgi:hypothetical protein
MPQQYVRIMLLQMFFIGMAIILTGFILKGEGAFFHFSSWSFPVVFRDYGFLLLIIPAAWCIWAICYSQRPAHDARGESLIGISGIALCAVIVLLGSMALWEAFKPGTYIVQDISAPRPTASPAH